MTKKELFQKTGAVQTETGSALQTLYDELPKGQQKQVLKNKDVKTQFDRHGVVY